MRTPGHETFFLPSLLLYGFAFPFRGIPSWAQRWGGPIGRLSRLLHGANTTTQAAPTSRVAGDTRVRWRVPLSLNLCGDISVENSAGDVVWFAPNEKHWHGAEPTTAMTHIAIQEALDGKAVEWMGKVSDEEYQRRSRSDQ